VGSVAGAHIASVFVECTFANTEFYWVLFNGARFVSSTFQSCAFLGATFADCLFVECTFDNCRFAKDNMGGDCSSENTRWYGCSFANCAGVSTVAP
jgi:uncharacterized protein YjbI with pentapeptide repeats